MHGLKQRYLVPIILIGIILFFFYEVESFYTKNSERKEELLTQNRQNVTMLIQKEKDTVHAIATQLTTDRNIIELYIKNDRQKLYEHLLPFWEGLKEKKLIHEMHFFKKPAVSYVNMSNIKSFNIDVSDVRSDIRWVTSSFKESSHLMVCKTYSGIRATYPIMDGKTLLGGVSVGKELDTLPETFLELTGKYAFITYFDDRLKHNLKPPIYRDYLADKIKHDNIVLASSTAWIDGMILQTLKFDAQGEFVNVDGKQYFLTHTPLYDFDQNHIGYFTTLHDFTPYYNDFKASLLKEILLFLIAGMIVYLAIANTTNKVLGEIKSIDAIAERIKENDFSILLTSNRQTDYDEIDRLKSNIFAMGNQIKNHIDNLESIIAKRTEELHILNSELAERVKEEVARNLEKDKLLFVQQNMAAKGELLGMIAHHWRQPLTSISLLVQDMRDAFDHDELTREYLYNTSDHAVRIIEELSETIDSFKAIFQEGGQEQTIETTLHDTLTLLSPLLEQKHIKFSIENVEPFGRQLVSSELANVLIPLLNNAVDAIDRANKIDGKITVKVLQHEGKTGIAIEDNGNGIDPAILGNIFEPYFSTKMARNSTGLGLFMANMIATRKLGATLKAENLDTGARFCVWLG